MPTEHGNWVNFDDLAKLADEYQDEINSLRDRLARLEPKAAQP
ncbi:hypothetical protein [Pseudomonas cremoricolorata]|nr:hypothetical protein [Pseudomonas cremoricolorata]